MDSKPEASPHKKISASAFDKKIMKLANRQTLQSSNIWRRVGAVLIKDDQIISSSSNRHLPSDHTPWIDGDPRGIMKRGVGLEMTTDMHAEAELIARAAKDGLSLRGASIYVTTFPCPNCAKLIARAGISKCYYSGGYAVLDGETVLKSFDVELIHVEGPEPEEDPAIRVAYPEKS